jgi:hypothetical protein
MCTGTEVNRPPVFTGPCLATVLFIIHLPPLFCPLFEPLDLRIGFVASLLNQSAPVPCTLSGSLRHTIFVQHTFDEIINRCIQTSLHVKLCMQINDMCAVIVVLQYFLQTSLSLGNGGRDEKHASVTPPPSEDRIFWIDTQMCFWGARVFAER